MNPKPSPQDDPIQLYRHAKAGQSHHAELMLAVLDLPYETVDVSTPERNPTMWRRKIRPVV